MRSSAGAWLNWSVCIELMTHMSSAIPWKLGTASDIHVPCLPCCDHLRGEPMSLGTPVVKANRRPLRKLSGQSWLSRFTSSGLWSNMSRFGGEPVMCR